MNRLLLAEVYKVFTTKLWWALLIPVAVISGVIGFAGAAIAGMESVAEEAGFTVPAVALTIPLSMQQATTFAAVLGLIGGAGEFRHKTITTTYLTASPRGAVLAAKAVVYAMMGLLYGLTTAVLCSLGAIVSSGTESFPSVVDTLIITAAGCAGVALWTVLAVGLGTLISHQVVVLILLLVYMQFFEGLVSLVLQVPRLGLTDVPPYLPGSGTTALQTDYGISVFADRFGDDVFSMREGLEGLVGVAGQLSWWAGGLLFTGYTAAFLVGGWLVGRRRDVS